MPDSDAPRPLAAKPVPKPDPEVTAWYVGGIEHVVVSVNGNTINISRGESTTLKQSDFDALNKDDWTLDAPASDQTTTPGV